MNTYSPFKLAALALLFASSCLQGSLFAQNVKQGPLDISVAGEDIAFSITNSTYTSANYPQGENVFRIYGNGQVKCQAVKVTMEGWGDDVFDPDYKLKSLEEVQEFIQENHHLPGIPGAEEIVNEGSDLGKMDEKMIRKIEELTLYVIELHEEVKELRKANKDLRISIDHTPKE